MKARARGRFEMATTFARAALVYWLSIFPRLRGELRQWRGRARTIPDSTLRNVALSAQDAKIGNIEGAVAFATLAPRVQQATVIRAIVAYQTIFDYLDCLCEMPNSDPIVNGRRLNRALITAVEPDATHIDYYAFHSGNADGGYLNNLVDTCRFAFHLFPSYPIVRETTRTVSKRIATYQSLNHGDEHGSHQVFDHWAKDETIKYQRKYPSEDLRWWEVGAAAGSSLAIFALIAAAGDSATRPEDIETINRAYFPWIGAVNSLLDSFIDYHEDDTPGQHSLLDYYPSRDEAVARLEFIVAQAIHHAYDMPSGNVHAIIIAAMVSFYLSESDIYLTELIPALQKLRNILGSLNAPNRFVMNARRSIRRR